MPDRLTPAQIRAARAMLDWSMIDLARAAGVSVSTVKRMESGELHPLSDGIRSVVRAAFETAGVGFLDDRDSVGVRIRSRVPP